MSEQPESEAKKPRKKRRNNRECKLIARVSRPEKNKVDDAAESAGLSVSEFVRHCVFLHMEIVNSYKK
jgi:uncharacterized protein (DUF1778 family)